MKRDLGWWLRITVPVVAVAALGIGLAGPRLFGDAGGTDEGRPAVVVGAEGISFVAFDDCESALDGLRGAALPLVGPYGFYGESMSVEDGGVAPPGAPGRAAAGAAESNAAPSGEPSGKDAQAPGHSTTNTHEAGVDEPDLVKTDGRRVISIIDGRLRVVDVAARTAAATLDLPGGTATQLLLDGDRALVLTVPNGRPEKLQPGDEAGYQSQLVLVDLAGGARIAGTLSVDGGFIDARQIGSVARVVLRSGPHLEFVYPNGRVSEAEALQRNREIVGQSSVSDWLPRYELERGGKREAGTLVDCGAVSRPENYTGTAMLTVLTVDLAGELGSGDAVSIVADGDTVYGTGNSLYVADDHTPRMLGGFAPMPRRPSPVPAQRTEVYQFDISGPGRPVHVASGGVDGTLLNQYSLSEFDGRLRIATTTAGPASSESAITVLQRQSEALVAVGKVGGLGVGERIYAVRFFGPTGYVVTFRETDPLYTVDLSDPVRPKVVGELKITGYSAYLHAAGNGRLIGVGQEATERGRRTGTQVSLFDTVDLAAARRLTQYQLPGGTSEVEYDPHAFLYWQEKGILVMPVMPAWRGETDYRPGSALVLRLAGDTLTEVGMIVHPDNGHAFPDATVRRALAIGDELWTVSGAGVMVSGLDGLAQHAWIRFT